ncbi:MULTISPECIES: hypothetical protein [unclassified Lentimonas]|uniref:hypothetical protein n=1 Tax=unclassified Lentimonas TaxID=2630993 RepID=UPI001327C540|nr:MULTISPECIES: hypothetical protein [unclassified Lentimonas]CAA6676646.1 Unannotated [Lentimonas sp. CC4]CAA6684691.1 Unannotated [Lentimonas sp. CC6]CAA7075326.1 Unannotated [Lentimonas sp. CC4]CAA7170985.1 Unannotated [Lentimonas sp. CC21]CAA7182266.1 Unannotated [Lentimonas sp. CC8]
MAAKHIQYKKLSGRSLLSVQSAHLGDDHLLVVEGHYVETYKRLYYNDIEAILVCPTSSGKVMAILLTILSVCMILPVLFGGWDFLPLAVFGVIPAVFAGVLFYGRGSVLFGVKTAVQTVILDGVKSRRKANRVEAQLSAEIERVQGSLSEPDLQAAIYKDAESHRHRIGAWAKEPKAPAPPPLNVPSAPESFQRPTSKL